MENENVDNIVKDIIAKRYKVQVLQEIIHDINNRHIGGNITISEVNINHKIESYLYQPQTYTIRYILDRLDAIFNVFLSLPYHNNLTMMLSLRNITFAEVVNMYVNQLILLYELQ